MTPSRTILSSIFRDRKDVGLSHRLASFGNRRSWSWSPFIQSPPSSVALARRCRSGSLLVLWSTTCNLHGQSPTREEYTNNPFQKPNFRGHAAGDGEVTRTCSAGKGTPTDDHPLGPSSAESSQGRQLKGGPRTELSKFVINPEPPKKPRQYNCQRFWNRSCPTPPRSQIPKKPAPQKSLQQVASSYRKSVIEKKGKVREQVDLFVVAQKAQVVLCYHKKGRQKENL